MHRAIFANAGYKFVSLMVAVFVWFHVTENQAFEQVISAPLRIVNLPPDVAVVSGLPDEVKIRVRAHGRLNSLGSKGIRVPVDLSDARPGRVTRLLSPADVEVPEGVRAEVLRVLSPGGLILECDSLVTRSVKVIPRIEGSPAEGFVLAHSPRANPPTVRLRGPARYLHNLGSVQTEGIDVGDLREDVDAEAPISLRNERGVEASPAHVVVSIPIEKMERFELAVVPVAVRGPDGARGLSWEPHSVRIEVRGARSRFDEWRRTGLALRIDARSLAPGEYRFMTEPAGGRVLRLVPVGADASPGDGRGAALARADGGAAVRALLDVPEFLEIASIAPRALHLVVR